MGITKCIAVSVTCCRHAIFFSWNPSITIGLMANYCYYRKTVDGRRYISIIVSYRRKDKRRHECCHHTTKDYNQRPFILIQVDTVITQEYICLFFCSSTQIILKMMTKRTTNWIANDIVHQVGMKYNAILFLLWCRDSKLTSHLFVDAALLGLFGLRSPTADKFTKMHDGYYFCILNDIVLQHYHE